MITQEDLKELLAYNPETGVFTNKQKRNGAVAGEIAGSLHKKDGYVHVVINGKRYMAHRLAWLYVYGEFPSNDVDHINRVRNDNRIVNLRAATRSENLQNQPKRKNNTSGYTGVTWNKRKNKWQVYISINKCSTYLGAFADKAQAVAVHAAARQKHQPFHTT